MRKIGNNNIRNNKKNMKKIVVVNGIGLIILIYFVYCIIQLIKQPTDIVKVERGKLSEEENAVRLCNTRRNGNTR